MKPIHFLVILTLASLSAGCSSHSLRPGIWEINFHNVIRTDTGEPLVLPKREARLEIDWAKKDKEPDVIEEVAINYVRPTTGGSTGEAAPVAPNPMFADVESREEREKLFRLKGQDEHWIWRMGGLIRDSETVVGTRVDARIRSTSLTAFEGGAGSWSMRWLRDK